MSYRDLKAEMLSYLRKVSRGMIDSESEFQFDAEGAIWWFANDYHNGGGSELYQILSTSKYNPAPSFRSIDDEEEMTKILYKELEGKFIPKGKAERNPSRVRRNSNYAHQDAKLWQIVKIGRSKYHAIGRMPNGVMLWKGSGPTIYVLIEKAQGEWGLGRFDNKLFAHPIAQQFSRLSENIRRYVRSQQKRGSAITPAGIWRNPVRKNIFAFNNTPSGPANEDAARELELYIDNDRDLHFQQFIPIVKNLMLKRRKGIYDREKAVTLFMYLMDSGAKKYVREFGTAGQKIDAMFNKNTRLLAARRFRDSFETEAEIGNYDRMIGPVSNPRPIRRGEKTIRCSCGTMLSIEGGGDFDCHKCGQWYNSFGQRLKDPSQWSGGREYEDTLDNSRRGVRRNIFAFNNPRGPRKLNAIEQAAADAGLTVTTWAPGDGMTRYRFFKKTGSERYADYDQGDALYTANGRADAMAFIRAYGIGRGRKNPYIRDSRGEIVKSSRNLRGIREYVGKHIVKSISISKHLGAMGMHRDALLQVEFTDGKHYTTQFADFGVLKNFVRQWRNVYGAPLIVNGVRSGKVDYHNPALKDTQTNPKASPAGSMYVIEGFTPFGRRGHTPPRRGEFRTLSLEEARARAEQIFQETGVVVAITKKNPLTKRETSTVVESARFHARMARSVTPGAPYRSHLLGVAEGQLNVAAQYGRGKNRGRAGTMVSAIDRMAMAKGGPYMRFSHKPIHRNPASCPNPCVRGDKLPYHLQQEVLRQYIYRWTTGNTQRDSAYRGLGTPKIPLISDAQWLREHAFHVTKAGKLDLRHHHAEPHYMADDWKKGDPRPNPLLQTVLFANPPLSSVWPRLTHAQREELLEIVGIDQEPAAVLAMSSWSGLRASTKGLLERGWYDTSRRVTGDTTRRRYAPVGARNPLTRRESARILKRAKGNLDMAAVFVPGHTRSEKSGQAFARAMVVKQYGPRNARRIAGKIITRAQKTVGTTMSNPGVRFPKPGTKLTVSEAMALARRIGDRDLIHQCQEAMRLQKKSNRGTKCVIWKLLPLGSKNRVDTVVALSHYGDSPEDMYKPPKGSKKGQHMYRHKWGEGSGRGKPVPVLAAPGGKAIIKVMGPGQKVGDWMRG